MSVPKSMQAAYDGIEPMITDFCKQYLDDEYLELCLHLLEKLCRKRPSPLLKGNQNTWAAAIVYAIGSNNFIFDRSQPIHMTADELCAPFGSKKSTVSNKAREIREMFDIGYFDPEWQLERLLAENPAIWFLSVNGFVIDIRLASVEMQEEAFRRGLIPYVPAYKETEKKEETPAPAPPKEEPKDEAPEEPAAPDDFSDIYASFGADP